jgi:hypothetical protein
LKNVGLTRLLAAPKTSRYSNSPPMECKIRIKIMLGYSSIDPGKHIRSNDLRPNELFRSNDLSVK